MTAISKDNKEKISISINASLLQYADTHQREHAMNSRSEVFEAALKALRRIELIESYREAAIDARKHPDDLLETGIGDGLEPSTEATW